MIDILGFIDDLYSHYWREILITCVISMGIVALIIWLCPEVANA